MCTRLAPRIVSIDVDGDRTVVRFAGGRLQQAANDDGADVVVRSDRDSIFAVIDGEMTLTEAVIADRLVVQGHPTISWPFTMRSRSTSTAPCGRRRSLGCSKASGMPVYRRRTDGRSDRHGRK
jgi:hypothetical protein